MRATKGMQYGEQRVHPRDNTATNIAEEPGGGVFRRIAIKPEPSLPSIFTHDGKFKGWQSQLHERLCWNAHQHPREHAASCHVSTMVWPALGTRPTTHRNNNNNLISHANGVLIILYHLTLVILRCTNLRPLVYSVGDS